MASMFYLDRFKREMPLTGLFIECVGHLTKGEEADAAGVVEILGSALVDSGLVEKDPTESQIIYIAGRMKEMREGDEKTDSPLTPSSGKYFAGYFTEWAAELDYVSLCLYVSDYDYDAARRHYEETDYQSIIAIAHEKLKLDFENARVSFEASLFGFGGGYKNTPKEGDNVVDLVNGGEEANRTMEAMMKGFF